MNAANRATLVFALVIVTGLITLGVAWWGVSGTLDVSNQLAYAVSGGAGGLALVVTGVALLSAHLGRCAAADERMALDRVLAKASSLAFPPPRPRRGSAARRGGR